MKNILVMALMLFVIACGSDDKGAENNSGSPSASDTGSQEQTGADKKDSAENLNTDDKDEEKSENSDSSNEGKSEEKSEDNSADSDAQDTAETVSKEPEKGTGQPVDGSTCLEYHALVKDSGNSYCSDCKAGDPITVYGAIKNNCPQAERYISSSSCLVKNFKIKNLDFNTTAEYPFATCTQGMTAFFVPSNLSDKVSRPAGKLSAGNYELEVIFDDILQTSVKSLFKVK